MTTYYYILSSDGCDETFDVYRDDECLASFPFWEQKTHAEEQAKRLVALLSIIAIEK